MPVEDVLLDLKFWSSKIYKKPMFNSRRAKITKELGNVIIYKTTTRLNLDYEFILNEQIRTEMSKEGSIFIAYV